MLVTQGPYGALIEMAVSGSLLEIPKLLRHPELASRTDLLVSANLSVPILRERSSPILVTAILLVVMQSGILHCVRQKSAIFRKSANRTLGDTITIYGPC